MIGSLSAHRAAAMSASVRPSSRLAAEYRRTVAAARKAIDRLPGPASPPRLSAIGPIAGAGPGGAADAGGPGPAFIPGALVGVTAGLPPAFPLVAGDTGTAEEARAPGPPLAGTGGDACEAIVSPQGLRASTGQPSVYRP